MSVNALAPNFGDKEGYLAWRKSWKLVYGELSQRIRRRKLEVRQMQREGHGDAPKAQRDLHLMRADATKMMTLLRDAKDRRDRILQMHRDIAAQPFPLEITARNVDFHFNKGAIQFPFLPKWVLKAKGKSYYIDHIDATIPWSTRELDKGSTLGMIRFGKCQLTISGDRVATLRAA